MKTISAIKKDLEFNSGLASLIEVLKSIAVAQFRAFEHKMKVYDRLDASVASLLKVIDLARARHPFANPPPKGSQVVVAVTSDTGLLGGINMQVVHTAIGLLQEMPGKLVVVGERGKAYARETGCPFAAFGGIIDDERLGQAMQLRDYCLTKMLEDGAGHLKVVYPHPVSFTVQHVRVAALLPFTAPPGAGGGGVIMESRSGDIVEYLARLSVGNRLYELFGYSRLAEFAARFIHLEGSAQRLKEMDGKLRLEYFRVRHELIDRGMRELFGARKLYGSKA